jgi:hypothetical protein
MKRSTWLMVAVGGLLCSVALIWPTGVLQRVRTHRRAVVAGSGVTPQNHLGPLPRPKMAEHLTPWLAAATGQGVERDFQTRLRAISQLGPNLSAAERTVLCECVRDFKEDKWLRPGQGFALKNDILNVLCEQNPAAAEISAFLVSLWRDVSQPLVIRDYALQHMAPLCSRVSPGARENIVRELLLAAEDVAQSYAGTALIALARIQQQHGLPLVTTLSDRIRNLLENPAANLLARISAVQLAGELRLAEAREAAQSIALDGAQPEVLRIAAVAAVGAIGSKESSLLLTAMANGENQRLRVAAAAAIRRRETLAEENLR